MALSYIFISLLTLPYVAPIFFDVKRYSADPKDGNEPYRPINYFINKQRKRSICLFMFCWKYNGNCKSSNDCCECKCKQSSTFYSDPLGCKPGTDLLNVTRNVGKTCLFATKKFGFNHVPLFHNFMKFKNIEINLPRNDFPLVDSVCNVGAIYDHDYHGHKLMLDRNTCGDIFKVDRNEGKLYLSYTSTNVSIWNTFRGRFLSLDINCRSSSLKSTFKSCFLFQVEGKYVKEADWKEPAAPVGHVCDGRKAGVAAVTRPKMITGETLTSTMTISTTNVVLTSKATTSAKLLTMQNTTLKSTTSTTSNKSLAPTTIPSSTLPKKSLPESPVEISTLLPTSKLETTIRTNLVKVTSKSASTAQNTAPTVIFVAANDSLTGTTIGILTGLGSGLAIVMICVIIWILIKKRKDIFQTQQVSSPTAQLYNAEANPYGVDHGPFHYDVPSVSAKSLNRQPSVRSGTARLSSHSRSSHHSDKAYKSIEDGMSSTDSGYDRQYSYIDEKEYVEDHEFECRDNSILLQNRGSKKSADMSKRPLPEKPMESGNPYYSVASFSEEAEVGVRTSDPNDLYSLYSTIEDFQQT